MRLKEKQTLNELIILLCIAIILAGILYSGSWVANRNRIQQKSEEYSQLYQPQESAVPTAPISSVVPSSESASLPSIEDHPHPTPNSDTMIFSLPTPPPVQDSFSDLLAMNSETIGFLRIHDLISLPVVQRENDNNYYLNHNFEQKESVEGALFLDGMNRLYPEDDCLIIYGHNMHNGTMFGELERYGSAAFLKTHPLISFDTIYENHSYVPIAAFPASMNPNNSSYFDVRQIAFSYESFELFLKQLKSRSIVDIPVDARFGDRLLLLVTCDYTKDDGRFVLALRQIRADESEEEISAQIINAT